jgi:hypothetical protein
MTRINEKDMRLYSEIFRRLADDHSGHPEGFFLRYRMTDLLMVLYEKGILNDADLDRILMPGESKA